ncbi:MAG: hypothetical protein HUK14_03500 [Muribaculaceae bacterium]|nr:hypothetical protein [Muribaculaceae bacterium]
MKKISALLLTAIVALAFSAGAMAQDRILKVVKGGEVVFTARAADIESITLETEYVDLGLPSGLKWATCNLDAKSPEEIGGYYGWGCTTPFKEGDAPGWSTYFQLIGGTGTKTEDCGTEADPLAEYVNNSLSIAGTEWDAAHAKLGGTWRIPTPTEIDELIENTTSEWTTVNGVNGRLFTSKQNGKTIFIPASDYCSGGPKDLMDHSGYCWGSISVFYYDVPCRASSLNFEDDELLSDSMYRLYGLPIRPVSE